MTNTQSYIFAGGGSGGHLFPGIAVADELRRRDPSCQITFVGSERPVERSILGPTGYEHSALPVESLRELRRSPVRFVRRNWTAVRQARHILQDKAPRWVIGLGGFASAPMVWTAARSGIPVLLIEQNVIPGAATRWLAGCARHICLSFAETERRLRAGSPTVVTGNPIRESILRVAEQRRLHHDARPGATVTALRNRVPWSEGTDTQSGIRGTQSRTLLILGGSQGAESLNGAVTMLLPELQEALLGWRIVHQTGPGRSAAVREEYQRNGFTMSDGKHNVQDFFPNVADLYASADLVISRAGATTLAELACTGCPAVLVPYPFAADQHQLANAKAFAQAGAAVLVPQSPVPAETAQRLRVSLTGLLLDENRRESMSRSAWQLSQPEAAKSIADLLTVADGTARAPRYLRNVCGEID